MDALTLLHRRRAAGYKAAETRKARLAARQPVAFDATFDKVLSEGLANEASGDYADVLRNAGAYADTFGVDATAFRAYVAAHISGRITR